MEKRWIIEYVEGRNSFKTAAYYLHGSGLWDVVLYVNNRRESAIQTDDPAKDALGLIADAQAELEHDRLEHAQQTVAAAA